MQRPHLSIIVPAYNEESVIVRTLTELHSHLQRSGVEYEIVVASDGSTDRTSDVVRDFARIRDERVRLLELAVNRGKGAALRAGIAQSTGEIVAYTDADLPYRLENLDTAIALVTEGATDVAVGARDLAGSEGDPSYPITRKFAGRVFSLLVTAVLRVPVFDTQCGLKAFRGEVARRLFSAAKLDGFGIDFEVMHLAARNGYRIARVPVGMSHRHESKVRLWRDSLLMLRDVFVVRARHASEEPVHTGGCPACLSDKVARAADVKGVRILFCSRCATRRVDPMPSSTELHAMYDADYFASDRPAELGYAAENPEGIRRTLLRRVEQVRQVLPLGASILEIGAALGNLGVLLNRDYRYAGIEISEDASAAARSKGLDVVAADLRSYARGTTFDAVILVHVFEHLVDPGDTLRRIAALLAQGGLLIIVTPDSSSMLARLSGKRWVSYKFPEHVVLYTRAGLQTLLERHGFPVERADSDSEYCDHAFIRSRLRQLSPVISGLAAPLLALCPPVLPVNSGSVRVIARKR